MKIGILQCGHAPDELVQKHGDYQDLFIQLLGPTRFEYRTWVVVDGDLPTDIHAVDGWLITGSRHGVYEDHPWIPPMETFLRNAYTAGVPIVGICFGHQLLAQALGGKVEKFVGGWSVGLVEYQRDDQPNPVPAFAYHQDQVVLLPSGATCYGSTDFCRYAFLRYDDRALTMQPHPEFTNEFLLDLLDTRGRLLPQEVVDAAHSSVGKPPATALLSREIADFFTAHTPAAPSK